MCVSVCFEIWLARIKIVNYPKKNYVAKIEIELAEFGAMHKRERIIMHAVSYICLCAR